MKLKYIKLLANFVFYFNLRRYVKGYNQRGLLMEMPYELRRKILYHNYSHIINKTRAYTRSHSCST